MTFTEKNDKRGFTKKHEWSRDFGRKWHFVMKDIRGNAVRLCGLGNTRRPAKATSRPSETRTRVNTCSECLALARS